MNPAKDKIAKAYKWATENRPKVNGYPYLAEALRQAGVSHYVYSFPSGQCLYFTPEGAVAHQGEVVASGMQDVPPFHKENFLKVLRTSQAGESTFMEFLKGSWAAGVVRYEADLVNRKVSYYGVNHEIYVEDFPAVQVKIGSLLGK